MSTTAGECHTCGPGYTNRVVGKDIDEKPATITRPNIQAESKKYMIGERSNKCGSLSL